MDTFPKWARFLFQKSRNGLMSLPFLEFFTVTTAADKNIGENAAFKRRMQTIEEKLSETEWTY